MKKELYWGVADSRTEPSKDHEVNQDCHIVTPNFFIIADGAGGSKAGEVAAEELAKYLKSRLEEGYGGLNKDNVEENMEALLKSANQHIFELGQKDESTQGMRAAVIIGLKVEDTMYFASVGDCSAYVLTSDRTLEKMTEEQTYAAHLLKKGVIGKNDIYTHPMRSALTFSIGTEKTPQVEVGKKPLAQIRYILAGSDGIFKYITERRINIIFEEGGELENMLDKFFKDRANPKEVAGMFEDDEMSFEKRLKQMSNEDDGTAVMIENTMEVAKDGDE